MMGNRWLLRRSGLLLICYGAVLFGIDKVSQSSDSDSGGVVMRVDALGQSNVSQASSGSRPAVAHKDLQETAVGSPGDVQIGEFLSEKQTGRLEVLNLSHQTIPELSFGLFNRFRAGPIMTGDVYREIMTKSGYEQWFQEKQTFWLIGFDKPHRRCKTPVQLGQVPREAHS